nr:ABC transporter substrate-binding protein [Paenibacillus sediminis]
MSLSLVLSACGGAQDSASNTAGQSATTDTKSAEAPAAVKDGIFKATDMSKNPEAAKNRKDTFIVGLTEPEGVFNPYFYHNGYDGNASDAMFASLIDYDKNGKQVPGLAESWDVSPDNLTYTFHLRKGLKYSDGSPVTADDVAFTLTILHDKSYDGEFDITPAHIKGGQEYKEGKASSIEGIKVIDPLTIQITTTEVNARTLGLISGPVLSKAYYGKNYKQGDLSYIRTLHSKPMGAGPYKLDKFIPGQEVRYVANPYYYKGKPAIEHFIYKVSTPDTNLQMFQAGETDYDGFTANAENFEQLQSLGFANVNVYTASNYAYLDINHKKPYLQDKRVRQALAYGLNRQQIVDTNYQGYATVANIPASTVSWAYTDDVNKYEYNPEKAKQLLDEAGWKVGADGIREKDGKKLTITWLGTKSSMTDILVPIATENYKEIGIQFQPEIMDFNALLTKREQGDYDLASLSTSILLDPSDGVEGFTTKMADNGYSDPKVDELYQKSISTLDINERKKIYTELFKYLNDDLPVIFFFNRKVMSATNGRIHGLEPNSYTGISGDLAKLTIEN